MKYIIAFDLSLNSTGIAVFSDDAKLIQVDSIDTISWKTHQEKLKKIADRLIELKDLYNPEKIIIEKGFYRFISASEAIWKVNGVCQYIFLGY
jgi:Holliday junction resolvasome RuvABC endonuclease subunit